MPLNFRARTFHIGYVITDSNDSTAVVRTVRRVVALTEESAKNGRTQIANFTKNVSGAFRPFRVPSYASGRKPTGELRSTWRPLADLRMFNWGEGRGCSDNEIISKRRHYRTPVSFT